MNCLLSVFVQCQAQWGPGPDWDLWAPPQYKCLLLIIIICPHHADVWIIWEIQTRIFTRLAGSHEFLGASFLFPWIWFGSLKNPGDTNLALLGKLGSLVVMWIKTSLNMGYSRSGEVPCNYVRYSKYCSDALLLLSLVFIFFSPLNDKWIHWNETELPYFEGGK